MYLLCMFCALAVCVLCSVCVCVCVCVCFCMCLFCVFVVGGVCTSSAFLCVVCVVFVYGPCVCLGPFRLASLADPHYSSPFRV